MPHWLTYAEAATRFSVSSEAVRQIAMRQKWPRRRPNDDPFGRVQVLIPDDAEIRPRPGVQHPHERPLDTRPPAELDTLRDAVERERNRADRAEMTADLERERADQAEILAQQATQRAQAADADRRTAEARADRAEQGRDDERARADALWDKAEDLQRRLAASEAEGNDLTIETAQLTAHLKQARAEAHEAAQVAEGLRQADAERQGRGRWARLRAAWRGD